MCVGVDGRGVYVDSRVVFDGVSVGVTDELIPQPLKIEENTIPIRSRPMIFLIFTSEEAAELFV
jgi:hypothetical protein